jgi:hypothetical protein
VATYDTAKPFKLVLTLQNCRFDGDTPDVGGPDVLEQSLPFKVLDDGTNPVVQVDYYTGRDAVAVEGAVQIEGTKELVRALRKVDGDLARRVTGELRGAAKDVANEARTIIREQHLVDSGLLLRSVRTSVRGGEAIVRDTATRDGYSYPRLYEFARHRPFLYPALERQRPAIELRMERMLDDIAGTAGL